MLSVIILTYNSIKFITACLDSVFDQGYQGLEIIIVDNGSKDGTAEFIRENYPQVRLIENKKNLGACRARNRGIEISKGDWILTLDCDVILEKDFLNKIVRFIEESESSTGMFQPKILKDDKKTIYSCGIYLSKLRRFYDIGKGKLDDGQFNTSKYIFGACTAAAIYRRDMLEEIKEDTGYFDERFFFLVEDVDLSWRAQKRGWKAIYYPEVVCYHFGNSSNYNRQFRQYLCFRNRYYSIIKNETFKEIFINFFLLSAYDPLRFFYLLFNNPYILKAIKEIFRFIKDESKQRDAVNNEEVNPVRELCSLTVCADPVRNLISNGADGGFKPPSALSGNDRRLKSAAFSNGVNIKLSSTEINLKKPKISVVIPVLNEKENIEEFYFRLNNVLANLGSNYEIIFVDDGSRDRSFEILRGLHQKNKGIKIIKLTKNFGQSAALLAGLKYAQGSIIITMDVDLQCNPEDIFKLIEKINQGFDVVCGYRKHRYDAIFTRRIPSFFMNKIMSRKTGIKLKDWGCSFGAARKEITDQILSCGASARFIKPLAAKLANNLIEVKIEHYKRKKGKSKYSPLRLIASALDFLINYSSRLLKSDRALFVVEEIIAQ